MHFLLFAILGSILVFFIVFCALAGMDYARTHFAQYDDTVKHAPVKKYARARKFILSLILGLVITFLASALVYITYIVRLDTIEKKIEIKNRDIAENVYKNKAKDAPALPAIPALPPAPSNPGMSQPAGSEDQPPPPAAIGDNPQEDMQKSSAGEELQSQENEAALFGDSFDPATEKVDRGKKADPPVPVMDKTPAPFSIRGAQPGDIYLLNYYDTLTDGRFTKSEGINFYPSSTRSESGVTVIISLPALAKGAERQLPILLDGSVIRQNGGDGVFELAENGTFTACAPCRMIDFAYTIRRHPKGGTIRFGKGDDTWLKKEEATIPAPIKDVLDSVLTRSDATKMGSVAAILNAYFGYQAGRKTVLRQEGLTWNEMLDEAIKKRERFSADCDVLATFAFTYLRYLGFRPALLLTTIPENAGGSAALTGDVHATLYLRSGSEWILFEPTVFTTIDSPMDTLPSTLPAEKIEDLQRSSAANIQGTEKTLEASHVSYFTLPQALLEKFRESDSTHRPEGRLAQYMVDILCNDDSPQQDNEPHRPEAPYMVIQFAVALFLLGSLLLKIFFSIQNERQKLFSMGRASPAYLLMLIVVLGQLFLVSWQKKAVVPAAGLAILLAGSVGSILSMLIRLHSFPPNYAKLHPVRLFFTRSLYPFMGILFALGALIITPHVLTLLTFSLMMGAMAIHTAYFFTGKLHE